MPNKRRRRKKSSQVYTTGEVNRAVDSLLHPLIRQNKLFVAIDELAHVAVERNLEESIVKFTRYRLPELVREMLRVLLESD